MSEMIKIAKIGELNTWNHGVLPSCTSQRHNRVYFQGRQYKVNLDIDADQLLKGFYYVYLFYKKLIACGVLRFAYVMISNNGKIVIFMNTKLLFSCALKAANFRCLQLILFCILDIDAAAKFNLASLEEDNFRSLWLAFTPNAEESQFYSRRRATAVRHIVETFFVVERENVFEENEEIDENGTDEPAQSCSNVELARSEIANNSNAANDVNNYVFDENSNGADSDDSNALPNVSIDDLYQQLREEHFLHDKLTENYTNEYIQHKHLRPHLTNYQINAVKWMLNREHTIDYFPTEFKPVTKRWPSECDSHNTFYYNSRTFQLLVHSNSDVAIPTGGILADGIYE